MNSFERKFLGPLLVLAMYTTVLAQAPSDEKPKTTDQLRQLLKTFPESDANKDGVLTLEEAQAYRKKFGDKAGAQAATAKPTHANVKYGPHKRNVLDFYQAKSEKPTPLVIHIHGGGFVGGDKSQATPAMITRLLGKGISFATINYRFVDGKETLFPAPQHDGARALQFLRSKASEWNLDPKRVGCVGGSAGAGISMWIGFHDDLADPQNSDPILRESTRIQVIGTYGGQGTYDPIKIKELIGGRAWEHPSIFLVYGVKTAAEALKPTPEQKKLYDECSAITHLTKDDPPLYMVYTEADGPLPADAKPGQGIHHPNFGRQLKEKMDELGIENVFVNVDGGKGKPATIDIVDFFEKQFAKVK
jgi:acetyl esterase